jgi:hypothetical protein
MHSTIHSELARQRTEQRIATATRARTARSALARFRRPE